MRQVLCELRTLAERMVSQATEAATPVRSELDNIRARRGARLARAQNREHPTVGD